MRRGESRRRKESESCRTRRTDAVEVPDRAAARSARASSSLPRCWSTSPPPSRRFPRSSPRARWTGSHGSLASRNVHGEVQKNLDVLTNEIFMRHCEWGGLLAGMASEEMEQPCADSRRVRRAATTCWRSIRSTAPRTSTSTCAVGSIFSVLRASGRRGAGGSRRFPAARHAPGRRRLCDLRAIDDAGADHRAGHARLHARPRDRQFHPHPSRSRDSGRYRRIRDQHVQRALLGAAGAALRERVQGRRERRARARLQHALDRLAGRRGAPHPDARRRVHVSARHPGARQAGPPAAALRGQSDGAC